MERISRFQIPNALAEDAQPVGVIDIRPTDLAPLIKSSQQASTSFLVCSGGTSSRCAADGYLTIDLRAHFRELSYQPSSKQVGIGAGNSMAELLAELSRYQRTFPTGLSGLPGLGYLLTAGISPLSRSLGLAIDQIIEIHGVWGNGQPFRLPQPDANASSEHRLQWRGLCGAAPFLGVVSGLNMQTSPLKALRVWLARLAPEQLSTAIQQAEAWPRSASLQWIWRDQVLVYALIDPADSEAEHCLQNLRQSLADAVVIADQTIAGLHELPPFAAPKAVGVPAARYHAEVLALLSPAWSKAGEAMIKTIAELLAVRPHPSCCIASQQLGGRTTLPDPETTSFIHRGAQWKPWITASWPAGDLPVRERSLRWLERVWRAMQPLCPGVHLAQLHPHLDWHQQELRSAFGDWLPGLQDLKGQLDPKGLLPPL
ncbi:MAG: FAD-binding protein [Prochlorococcus sp.]